MKLTIQGGRIYDPANGVDGVERTLFIRDDCIVEPFPVAEADRTVDASGCVVLPGGVDMHCHIAGPAVNRARLLMAGVEPRGVGRAPVVPSAAETARLYSSIGYTTAVDAAISPSGSRPCYREFAEACGLDTGFLLLLGNNELILDLLEKGERELACEAVAHLLETTGALGIKAVNAGGVEAWKRTGTVHDGVDEKLDGRSISPRDILGLLGECATRLALPHPLHVHVAKLGVPGNIDVTLETSRGLAEHRHHFAHVAFNVYAKAAGGGFASAASRFLEHLADCENLTADVGQLWFGETITLSADREVVDALWGLGGKPYATLDLETEGGFGMLPIEYRDTSRIHALQWAIGMELMLLSPNPWRLVFSTDHPNGASFLAYPTLLAQLMDRGARDATLERLPAQALAGSVLPDLDREYSFYEIAIVTRAGPARILGLKQKGHLGVGADADVAVYRDQDDREVMFRSPRYVVSRGRLAVDDGSTQPAAQGAAVRGTTLRVAPDGEVRGRDEVRRWFREVGTYHADQLGPREEELVATAVVGETRS